MGEIQAISQCTKFCRFVILLDVILPGLAVFSILTSRCHDYGVSLVLFIFFRFFRQASST